MSQRLAFAIALSCLGACSSEGVLSYQEFKDRAYQEPETGAYVINGDEVEIGEPALRAAYDRYLDSVAAAADRADGLGTEEQGLIINTVNGRWDAWPAATAQNLTYCVSSSSFGSRYNAVVTAMESATSAWEATASVNFVHVTAQDANCTRSNNNVIFDVRQVNTQQYLARAFFPSTSRSGREVLISSSSFGNITPYTLAGVLRHELGHTIGFRHEHTRPESGACFEDNNWAPLTSYDAASVMHYPQCNGTNRGDLVLTSKDKSGARVAYP